jgi:hypothetical protein
MAKERSERRIVKVKCMRLVKVQLWHERLPLGFNIKPITRERKGFHVHVALLLNIAINTQKIIQPSQIQNQLLRHSKQTT